MNIVGNNPMFQLLFTEISSLKDSNREIMNQLGIIKHQLDKVETSTYISEIRLKDLELRFKEMQISIDGMKKEYEILSGDLLEVKKTMIETVQANFHATINLIRELQELISSNRDELASEMNSNLKYTQAKNQEIEKKLEELNNKMEEIAKEMNLKIINIDSNLKVFWESKKMVMDHLYESQLILKKLKEEINKKEAKSAQIRLSTSLKP